MLSTKAKNKKQLAEEFGMSLRTLQRRLKANHLDVPRGLINPELQNRIKNELGWEDVSSGTSQC